MYLSSLKGIEVTSQLFVHFVTSIYSNEEYVLLFTW